MMEHQIRGKHLKELQGQVWKRGYEQGEIYGHVYDDVLPTFQWMAQQGIHIYLYSSASIQAQQLQFQYSTSGKLIHFLSGHYDLTNAGPKRNVESYKTIVTSLTAKFHRLQARDIVFVSDEDEELLAATKAGLQTVLSIRPGNNQCSGDALKRFAQVHSLLQLCGGDQLYWW
jgi:enolase-phosphatase E1